MKLILSSIVLIVFTLSALAEKARFDNYRVYSISVENELQLRVLRELTETSDSYSFWDEPTRVDSTADLIVPPHQFAHFSEIVEKFNLQAKLTISNLQELIDNERPKKERKAGDELDWIDYHSLGHIYEWLDKIQAEFPEYITIIDLGRTYEGKPLKMVKLSKQTNNRALFLEANIHAREWISSATTTWILNEFLYSTDPEVQDIAKNVDWYIVPVANPDGYEYTRNVNRNWRKTRSPVSLVCYGVDPNRNWAHNWLIKDEVGDEGASRAPCSDLYAGPHPFSENETTAIDNFLAENYQKFDVYLTFHSYAHMILHPYGHQKARVSNFDALQAIGLAAAERLQAKYGIQYEVGGANELLYAASGTSIDHAYGRYNISIGYTYEMRGNGVYGNYGFFLPAQFIIPNAEEVLASLIGLVVKAREYGYLNVPAIPTEN